MDGIRNAALAAVLGLVSAAALAVTTAEFASKSQVAPPASAATPPTAAASKAANTVVRPSQPADDKARAAPKPAR